MNHALLRWAPRVVALAFAAFLSVFAFAAFADGHAHGLAQAILHFLASLLPALLVLGALAVAWRREALGAALFLALAAGYVVWAWGRFPLSTYAAISGPLALVGALFLVSSRARRAMG